MSKKVNEIDLLVETSWEVCNKIGGIYTVLSTKARTMKRLYNDNLIFIGPDVWTADNPSPYFTEDRSLLRDWAETSLFPEGVDVRVGRWDIPGQPIVILVKFDGMYKVKDQFYGRMWELYGVDSLHAYGDYDEGCAFAHAAGIVVESLVNYRKSVNAVAHFDEWTTGMGLLYVKDRCPKVATVFTTHATSIGRSICGNGKPLYDYLHAYDGDQMARELNMEAKHSLEKAAAHQADCFTTVSDVTARECEQLLGRRPDVVTPNGFESSFVPAAAKLPAATAAARKRMLDVASALTGVEYADADTFIIGTSGRCEYRNKGLDLYLDTLATLGGLNPKRRVLAFVMVPAWVKEARADLRNALDNGLRSRLSDPVITHTLNNHGSDPVDNRIHAIGFANDRNSTVSVIYVPCYLNGDDGIFNMSYYDLLPGFDATAFASYYEPWGYTPLESVAFSVPTVTTTLAGFGQWVLDEGLDGFEKGGVRVEVRNDSNYDHVRQAMAADLADLIAAGQTKMKTIRTAARKTARMASWANFIKYYEKAYETALQSARRRNA